MSNKGKMDLGKGFSFALLLKRLYHFTGVILVLILESFCSKVIQKIGKYYFKTFKKTPKARIGV